MRYNSAVHNMESTSMTTEKTNPAPEPETTPTAPVGDDNLPDTSGEELDEDGEPRGNRPANPPGKPEKVDPKWGGGGR
jgi:hypothetical protein